MSLGASCKCLYTYINISLICLIWFTLFNSCRCRCGCSRSCCRFLASICAFIQAKSWWTVYNTFISFLIICCSILQTQTRYCFARVCLFVEILINIANWITLDASVTRSWIKLRVRTIQGFIDAFVLVSDVYLICSTKRRFL